MALEAPTAPAAAASPNASPAAPPPAQTEGVKTQRTRNEYPEAYDELESLERTAPKPPASAKTPEPPKPAAKPDAPAKEPEKESPAAAKPAETTKTTPPADKPAGEVDEQVTAATAQFKTAHDLRKAYYKLNKEVVPTLEKQVAELRAKVENGTPERSAALDEAKALRKRLEEVEGELKYYDYTKSKEFKDKFEAPYNTAYEDAVEEIKELSVIAPDGSTRPATERDLQLILRADNQDVRKLANELFGDAASDVLAARRKLNDLTKAANRESKKYREEAAEREKQRVLKAAEEKENMERLWKKAVTDVREKYKQYFGTIEGDDEYNKTLESGYANVDMAHNPSIPIEEKVARLAVLRHKAAAFGAQVLKTKRLEARVAELEEVVAGYEKSAPGAGKGGEDSRVPHGHEDGSSYADAESEIEALARKDTTEE